MVHSPECLSILPVPASQDAASGKILDIPTRQQPADQASCLVVQRGLGDFKGTNMRRPVQATMLLVRKILQELQGPECLLHCIVLQKPVVSW